MLEAQIAKINTRALQAEAENNRVKAELHAALAELRSRNFVATLQ
jgi:hypothetical protein